ncbi:hypothetical protein G6L37_06330 [Agrobacterium rubi]|nr:hypothetical protein [Agrobacterium rubi]NTF24979.1 hypothetical protein [Agrobacterium rubi]
MSSKPGFSIVGGKSLSWPQLIVTSREIKRRVREDGTFACEYCDDTGDVHSIIGDWLGVCHCEYGQELQGEIDVIRARRSAEQESDQQIGADG